MALLTLLQENARRSFAELARAVRLTAPAVAERVRRLEDASLITGYHGSVDLKRIGRQLQVYLRVFVPPREYPRFERMIDRLPEVIECHHVTGAESFIVRAAVTSIEHLEQLIRKMTAFGETTTSVILSTQVARKNLTRETGTDR